MELDAVPQRAKAVRVSGSVNAALKALRHPKALDPNIPCEG